MEIPLRSYIYVWISTNLAAFWVVPKSKDNSMWGCILGPLLMETPHRRIIDYYRDPLPPPLSSTSKLRDSNGSPNREPQEHSSNILGLK